MAGPSWNTELHIPKPLEPQTTRKASFLGNLGPGLITGAADVDPGGISTHSQAGAVFGLNMLWTIVATFPLMAAIQSISARIGRVTGQGLASNIKQTFPPVVLNVLVGLLFFTNSLNIAADIAAMGQASALVLGFGEHGFALMFGVLSLLLQVLMPYHRYVRVLKWLTLSLFSYVAVVMTVQVPWLEVAARTVWPHLEWNRDTLIMVVAVFGTTISPYMFFWQSSQEVEDLEAAPLDHDLRSHPEEAPAQLRRIGLDTFVGMAFSNLISMAIILAAAVALHEQGITKIETAAQAAMALRPVAGEGAFLLFSLGIIGTGLLAVPVLAGSAAYAIAEARGWPEGLERKANEARGFYGVIAAAMILGVALGFSPIDPIKALYWSAVVNGVISVPIMAAMMVVATSRRRMGDFVATPGQRVFGWAATGIMAIAVTAMFLVM
jgi:NRAMP (natural resistance-associated macrophage protein)-like metal ion transporter